MSWGRRKDGEGIWSIWDGDARLHQGAQKVLSKYILSYKDKNHIKAIDTTLYTQNKLQIIDLAKNKLQNIRSVLSEAQGVFAFLKVLKLDSNSI